MEEVLKNQVARTYLLDFLKKNSDTAFELAQMWQEVEERRRHPWLKTARHKSFLWKQPLHNYRASSYFENQKTFVGDVVRRDSNNRPRSEVYSRSSTLNSVDSSQNFRIPKSNFSVLIISISGSIFLKFVLDTDFSRRKW